ncbi:MAG TPA: hypothetical protein DIC60_04735 [Lachnospiraceae bacterium]|nr:hypothetical protein [Lachnospiraceae bacterium]
MIDKKKAMSFVRDYMYKHEGSGKNDNKFWRTNAKNRFEHTKRVFKYAKMLSHFIKDETFSTEVVEIAAIFHDVATFSSENHEHSAVSAKVAREYLQNESLDNEFIDKVCNSIANHSKKTTDEKVIATLALEDKVLIDADIVDETGIASVIWVAMKQGKEELCYEKFIKKLDERYFTGYDELINYVHTKKAKEILIKNKMLVKGIVHTLEIEIRGDII